MNLFLESIVNSLEDLEDARQLSALFPQIVLIQRKFLTIDNYQVKLFTEVIYQKEYDEDDEGGFTTEEGEIRYGRREGLWISKGLFTNKTYYYEGVAEGKFQQFDQNGNLTTEGEMEGGRQVGLWKYYPSDGHNPYDIYY